VPIHEYLTSTCCRRWSLAAFLSSDSGRGATVPVMVLATGAMAAEEQLPEAEAAEVE